MAASNLSSVFALQHQCVHRVSCRPRCSPVRTLLSKQRSRARPHSPHIKFVYLETWKGTHFNAAGRETGQRREHTAKCRTSQRSNKSCCPCAWITQTVSLCHRFYRQIIKRNYLCASNSHDKAHLHNGQIAWSFAAPQPLCSLMLYCPTDPWNHLTFPSKEALHYRAAYPAMCLVSRYSTFRKE